MVEGFVILLQKTMVYMEELIYRSTSIDGTYVLLSGGSFDDNDFIDENVEVGTTYYYKMSYINLAGEGPKTEAVEITASNSTIIGLSVGIPVAIIAALGITVFVLKKSRVK